MDKYLETLVKRTLSMNGLNAKSHTGEKDMLMKTRALLISGIKVESAEVAIEYEHDGVNVFSDWFESLKLDRFYVWKEGNIMHYYIPSFADKEKVRAVLAQLFQKVWNISEEEYYDRLTKIGHKKYYGRRHYELYMSEIRNRKWAKANGEHWHE